MNFFRASNAVATITNFYLTNGTPFMQVVVENPDASATNRLRITENRDGTSRVWDYLWSSTSVILTNGGGISVLTKTVTSNSTARTEVRQIQRDSDSPVFIERKDFQVAAWGIRLTNQIVGSGAAARTNSWLYDANGFLLLEQMWDGQWKRCYNNSSGLSTNTLSGVGTQGPTTDASLCRSTVSIYDTNTISGSGDAGAYHSERPRCVIDYLYNHEIARKYFIFLEGEEREIACLTPGATWNASDNLVTTRKLFKDGFFLGEPQLVQRPDQTIDSYRYDLSGDYTSYRTNIVCSGHSDATGTNVDDGSKTITVYKNTGELLSRTIIDVASGVTNANDVYSEFDADSRAQKVTYLDGTWTYSVYSSCCGQTLVTNREGTATFNTYDALKRLVSSITQNPAGNITISNYYDAAGNLLRVTRTGADGTTFTNRTATFDLAGRIVTATDALGNTNYYSESFPPLVKTTIYPDGSTRIESFARDGSLLRMEGMTIHGVLNAVGYENSQYYAQSTKLNTNGTTTAETVKTYRDLLGRTTRTAYPDNASANFYYNSIGQLTNEVDPDGVSTLYFYNALGEQEYAVMDMNRDGQLDWGGPDRIARTARSFGTRNGIPVQQVLTYIWATNDTDGATLVSTVETSTDGRTNWTTRFGLITRQEMYLDTTQAKRTVITVPSAGPSWTNISQHGQLISSGRGPLGTTTYAFDNFGRPWRVTDARNGTTTNWYDNADRVWKIATPAPGNGQASQVTTIAFDWAGRATNVVQPDGASAQTEYFPTGETKKKSGAREYPVAYTYDYAGRMQTMTTWTNAATSAGTAVTTWNYDTNRGWLNNKRYADSKGPDYTYTDAGRLKTRAWARGITTTYGYDNAGAMQTVVFSDGTTPGVTNVYDRLGRKVAAVQGGATNTLTYNSSGQIIRESFGAVTVTNGYDGFGRRNRVVPVNAAETALMNSIYTYDGASGRMLGAYLFPPSGSYVTAAYTYLTDSPLVEQITFKQVSTERMKTTRAYDKLNRLTSIVSSNGVAGVVSSHAYQYNPANQRLRADVGGASSTSPQYWIYDYDKLGQVTSGKKYWSDGTPVAGQQFGYGFDDIGNRQWVASGGNEWGAGLRYENYSANNLNQYTSRTVPGHVDVMGAANSGAEVTVQSSTGVSSASRKGEYFRAEVRANNTVGPLWLGLTNLAILRGATTNIADITTTNSGFMLVPPRQQVFAHDADGNLTNDGVWSYRWDGENRLIEATNLLSVPSAGRAGEKWTLLPDGRWIERVLYGMSGSSFVPQSTNRFVWDGQVLLAIVNETNGLVMSFLRGLDLSGTFQGAGGVGGVLAVSSATNGTHFCSYDGNGNVMALTSATNGTVTAQYEYDPFGKALRATGPMAKANPIRFSTQFANDVLGTVKYLFRDLQNGRWLSRDPLGERGGNNIFRFVRNNPINLSDLLGLAENNCREAIGSSGQPRIIFDIAPPKGGWKVVGIHFDKQGSAQAQMIDIITITFEASVSVLCQCSTCYEIRHGVRTYKDSEFGSWLIADPTKLPLVPCPMAEGLTELLGELAGELLFHDLALPIPADEDNGRQMLAAIRLIIDRRPTAANQGEWKGGTSPCAK